MSLALAARFVLGSNLGQIGIGFRAFLYPGVPGPCPVIYLSSITCADLSGQLES